jgi:uncharacterized protein YbjQ (UPF0145 family)
MKTLRQIGSIVFVAGLFVSIFGGVPWHVIVADDPVVPMWLRISIFCFLGGFLVVLLTLAYEQLTNLPKIQTSSEIEATNANNAILTLNSDTVPNRPVAEVLGVAQGHTVYAIWLGNDLSAIVRLILGGELTEYTEMMGTARSTALARMKAQAAQMGADAIINVRYMTTSVIGSAAELLVYGTAVKLG